MAKPYKRKPCRRCGGEKEPRVNGRYSTGHTFYCSACAAIVRGDYIKSRHYCASPSGQIPHWECLACRATLGERRKVAAAKGVQTRARNNARYFKPQTAETYWQQRCHAFVNKAIKRGLLPDLKSGEYACVDCGRVAHEYEHRDYSRPLDVEPVCRSCNKRRGSAKWPTPEQFQFRRLDAKLKAA